MIVNENYIKEYEEMSLCDFADELVEPLCTIKKDLTKTIYIHYAEERDKNYKLEQENARLKDKIQKATNFVDKYMDEWDFQDEVWQDMNDLLILLKEN